MNRNAAHIHTSRQNFVNVLLLCFASILTDPAAAQTFTVLHDFTGGSDGAYTYAPVIPSGNILYGAAAGGGPFGHGVVFAMNFDGTCFTNLYNFTAGAPDPLNNNTNGDGSAPVGLLLSGDTLYGTAFQGGFWDNGTLFRVNTDGSGFTNLHNFTSTVSNPFGPNGDGANPNDALILLGNTLYGTAYAGGTSGAGTLFAVNTDGSDFSTLYNFTALSGPYLTNNDGGWPYASLLLASNTLFGVTSQGGTAANGTMFAIQPDGTDFTNLHTFDWTHDGGYPVGTLISSSNTLYGIAFNGGPWNHGTVFAINPDGSDLRILHNFSAVNGSTNSDGANPTAGLVLANDVLYGTTRSGGASGVGTVFALHTDGSGFTTLHSFNGSDGAQPYAPLTLSGNSLFGTTYQGGGSGFGTVFSISFSPRLSISISGTNAILRWPIGYAGFDYTGYTLQSTTNLNLSTVWTTVVPAPVTIDGQNVVTNAMTTVQQFYRLIH
jgi:uncharacterized repeat protein (TIGR03803 family)